MNRDPIQLTQELVRCPSITPVEGGALEVLQKHLTMLGFTCHRLKFSEAGTPDVDNLFARLGDQKPHVCYVGHTDVVPTGDLAAWSYPPFEANIIDDRIIGRGTSDMKGGIACFLAATQSVLTEVKNALPGSISFLITGDEEGPSINGTRKVLEWMALKGHVPDQSIVGEPTNEKMIGDTIKIGRRGCLDGEITLHGKRGHVAYADLARNPLPGLGKVIMALSSLALDKGTAHFQPSNLEVTSIDVDNTAFNVIPADGKIRFNIRFNDLHSKESLDKLLHRQISEVLADTGLTYDLWTGGLCEAFLTQPGAVVDKLMMSIKDVTGQAPKLSTGGGTSDARFVKNYCPVVEFGLLNTTIHQINEHVMVDDLHKLTKIYHRFLCATFGIPA